jgi:hypothetical protein
MGYIAKLENEEAEKEQRDKGEKAKAESPKVNDRSKNIVVSLASEIPWLN